MEEFRVSFSDIEKLIQMNHFPDNISRLDWFFVGIRGAVPSDVNAWKTFNSAVELMLKPVNYINYNCTIIQANGSNLSPFRATTLPSKHYVDSPLNPNGAARLLQGRHMVRQGYHKVSDLNKRYPAFRQNGVFPLLRDTNMDLKFDWDDADTLSFTKSSGINIHYGKGSRIGLWSAGCQAVNTDIGLKKWSEFRTRVYKGKPDISKNYHYYLFDADYVAEFVKTPRSKIHAKHRLLWGSYGRYVKELQIELKELGYDVGKADGIFGPKTMTKGVIPFKEINFEMGNTDPIVDIAMWNHLFSDNAAPNV